MILLKNGNNYFLIILIICLYSNSYIDINIIISAIVGREKCLRCSVCASGSAVVAIGCMVVVLFLIFVVCAKQAKTEKTHTYYLIL